VHERIGGGEQLGHVVHEAEQADARLRAVARRQPFAQRLVAAAHHHASAPGRSSTAVDRTLDVPTPAPPDTTTRRVGRQLERLARVRALGRAHERGSLSPRTATTPCLPATSRTSATDSGCVTSAGPRRGAPEPQRREVGDGGHHGHPQPGRAVASGPARRWSRDTWRRPPPGRPARSPAECPAPIVRPSQPRNQRRGGTAVISQCSASNIRLPNRESNALPPITTRSTNDPSRPARR